MRVYQKSQVVRPEGAEAPSPGQRPGCNTSKAKRPVRAKALIMNAFALTGRIIIISVYPGRCPGLGAIWAFSPHCLSFDTSSIIISLHYCVIICNNIMLN